MVAASAIAFALQILESLKVTCGPLAEPLARRMHARELRVAIATATLIWAGEGTLPDDFPPPAEVIACDIARLVNTGRPLDSHVLAKAWVGMGCDEIAAGRSAERYVNVLDDRLHRIGWFTTILVSAAQLAQVEIQQGAQARRRSQDVATVAGYYFSAAGAYVAAAASRLDGDESAAVVHVDHAHELLRRAGTYRSWRVLATFEGVDLDFEAVEGGYEALLSEVALHDLDQPQKTRLLQSFASTAERFRATVSQRASRPVS